MCLTLVNRYSDYFFLAFWMALNNVENCPLKDITSSKISTPSFNILTVTQPSASVIATATEALTMPPVTVPTTGIYLDVVGDTMLFFPCTMSFFSILCHFSFWAIKKGNKPIMICCLLRLKTYLSSKMESNL